MSAKKQPSSFKYDTLMEAGQYKEAMEYADAQVTALTTGTDEWLDRASKAHCKLIDEQQRGK